MQNQSPPSKSHLLAQCYHEVTSLVHGVMPGNGHFVQCNDQLNTNATTVPLPQAELARMANCVPILQNCLMKQATALSAYMERHNFAQNKIPLLSNALESTRSVSVYTSRIVPVDLYCAPQLNWWRWIDNDKCPGFEYHRIPSNYSLHVFIHATHKNARIIWYWI